MSFLHDGIWQKCTVEYKETLISALKNAVKIPNFSAGCPFELELQIAMSNGSLCQMKYSTDDCGIIIIEDCTFELPEKIMGLLRDLN